MTSFLIEIAIGYIFFSLLPGKITAGTAKVRSFIDLAFQIIGILLMVAGVGGLIEFVFHLFK